MPTLPAAAGLCVGIAVYTPSLFWIAVVAAAAGLLLFVFSRYYRGALYFVTLASGMAVCHLSQPYDKAAESECRYEGMILSAGLSPNSVRCVVETKFPVKSRIMLTVNTQDLELYAPGTIVSFTAKPESVSAPDDVPWQTNRQRYLYNEGIGLHAFVTPDKITVERKPSGLRSLLNRLRSGIAEAIVSSGVDGPTAAFLLAVILADDVYVSPDAIESFRLSGLAHMLALSGLHVGIIASLVMLLLIPVQTVRGGFYIRYFLAVAAIWAYAFIAGISPSILRATIMFTVYIISKVIERDYIGFNSLFTAIIVILLINPLWLFTPGFQLSVLSVASILGFFGCLPRKFQKKRILYHITCAAGVPVAAMLGSGVVSTWVFGYFPGTFLASNIVTGILFPWTVISGVAAAALSCFGIVIPLLASCVDTLYSLMAKWAEYLSNQEWARTENIYFSPYAFIPYFIGICVICYALCRRNRTAGATGCTLVALSFITAFNVDERMPQTEAYALRTAGYTDLIIRQNGECRYYNSGEPRHAEDIEQACQKFALRRRCRNIAPLPSSTARIVLADSTSIAILGSTSLAEEYAGADYLLVTKGFRGNAAEIAALRPDTVLMSSGINRRRAKRIIQELAEKKVPVINLREERWRHIKD